MFVYRAFEVVITRKVDQDFLCWPRPGDAGHDSGLGCNRHYCDLRKLPWTEAKRVLVLEKELIARIEDADDSEMEYERLDEELYESDDNLYGLDLGVASTVIALSAAGCIPFSSCNGGVFGGSHQELYPLVAFYSRPAIVELLLSVAAEAGIGLEARSEGYLVAFSNDIRRFPPFAEGLLSGRRSFRDLQRRPSQM